MHFALWIAPTHSVKKNGLDVIYNCYVTNSGFDVAKCVIVFVTPVNGKLNTKQQITTKTEEVVKGPLPVKIGSVEISQYKLENALGEYLEAR